MDATRKRRQQDASRTRWYARYRQLRLARHMQFPAPVTVLARRQRPFA